MQNARTPLPGIRASARATLLFATSLLLGLSLPVVFGSAAFAADPTSGTLSEANRVITWNGPTFSEPTLSQCDGANDPTCDNFRLSFIPPASGSYAVKITIQPFATGDWDLQVFNPDGTLADDSGNGPSLAEEVTLVNPSSGTYTVAAAPFAPAPGPEASYTGKAELISIGSAALPVAPLANVTPPRYQNHTPSQQQIAQGMGRQSSDEPNIGANWKTGSVFFQSFLQTLRVKFDEACEQTPSSNWETKSPLTSQQSFDPILFSDHDTGLVVVSQLGFNPIVGLSSVSLDDGETWIPSQGSGINSGIDHQSVGGGPYHAPVPPNPVYPNAVYYCSQDTVMAQCALSVDAGITYGPAVPIYTSECGGLHGHLKVGPDGTAYVPNASCQGEVVREQAVVVSENNGASWNVRRIPGTLAGNSDPSVATDSAGRLYVGFVHNNHIPAVAVSEDRGLTWKNIYDVGSRLGIKNAAFPAVVAGDSRRAAFAFYGTTADGSVDDFAFPPNAWHLYVAHTYDGGDSW
jgi:hypothetical protein